MPSVTTLRRDLVLAALAILTNTSLFAEEILLKEVFKSGDSVQTRNESGDTFNVNALLRADSLLGWADDRIGLYVSLGSGNGNAGAGLINGSELELLGARGWAFPNFRNPDGEAVERPAITTFWPPTLIGGTILFSGVVDDFSTPSAENWSGAGLASAGSLEHVYSGDLRVLAISSDRTSYLATPPFTLDSYQWVLREGQGPPLQIWTADNPAPGVEGSPAMIAFDPKLILGDQTIFAEVLAGTGKLYYRIDPNGTYNFLFANQGNAYPGIPDESVPGTFSLPSFDYFDVSDEKTLVFHAFYIPDGGVGSGAVFTIDQEGNQKLIAAAGTRLNPQDENSDTFSQIGSPTGPVVRIDSAGNILFHGALTSQSGDFETDTGVFRYVEAEGIIERVSPVPGSEVPGLRVSEEDVIPLVRAAKLETMNSSGRVVISINDTNAKWGTYLQDGDGGFGPVIYDGELWNPGDITPVAANPMSLHLSEDHVLAFIGVAGVITATSVGDLMPAGDDYIWDGGAGTDDWHTVANGRSNWVDSVGTPWSEPPGIPSRNDEEVLIGSGFTVKLSSPAKIDNLRLEGGVLEINSDLDFQFLVDVSASATLTFNSGSLKSTVGLVEIAGSLLKETNGNFETDVVAINLDDATFSVERGSLLLDNGETKFNNTILFQAGGELTLNDEVTRFQGPSAIAQVLGGSLDLKSKNIRLETNTVFETATDSVTKLGGEQADATLLFDGGTNTSKRTLEFKGNGDVEVRVGFSISVNDEVLINNSEAFSNEGVKFNMPDDQKVTASGKLINNGRMTLQRGGLIDQVENDGLLIVKAANNEDTLALGFENSGRIEQFSDIVYSPMLFNTLDATYYMYGGTLTPKSPDSDILVFEKLMTLSVKEGVNKIQFPDTESSRLSTSINIEGPTSLEISNSRMTEEVKITVEEEESSVTIDEVVFENLEIVGDGTAILRGELRGTVFGGVSPDIRRTRHVELRDSRKPAFLLSSKSFRFISANLSGPSSNTETLKFNIGDFSQSQTVPYKSNGSASGLAIAETAQLIIGSSANLTTESPIAIRSALWNLGTLTLNHSILSSDEDAKLYHGIEPYTAAIIVPENVSDPVVIEPLIVYHCSSRANTEVGDGSQLIIRSIISPFCGINGSSILPFGQWKIGNESSLLFLENGQTIEAAPPITDIRGELTIGKPRTDGLPSLNGFPTRNVDLTVSNTLTLIDTFLEMNNSKIFNDNRIKLTRSEIRGQGIELILRDTVSLAAVLDLDQGTVIADVFNAGALNQGTSPGEGKIDGDLTMEPEGIINIEFAGTEPKTEYDQLEVTGTANLDGKLNLYFLDGYEPTGGEEFEFLKAPTINGNFSEIDQSRLGRNIRFDFTVGDTGLMATAMPLTIGSYADWHAAFFTGPDAADDEISGPDEDPDGDGSTNRMEYLFDGNPNVPEGSPVTFSLQAAETPGNYHVAAIVDWISEVSDAIWYFETSPDMEAWTEVATSTVNEALNEDVTRSVVNFSDTVDASERIFIRMRAREAL